MVTRRIIRGLIAYPLLVVGAVVFSIPFAWMASTSVKVDRELFAGDLSFVPATPNPRALSPYVDDTYYPAPAKTAREQDILAGLAGWLQASGYPLPEDIDQVEARRQIVRGLYDRLSRTLPENVWNGPVAGVLKEADRQVTPAMIGEVFANIHRRFSLGQIRARSIDLEDEELGAGEPYSQRLENQTPRVARLSDRQEKALPYASVDYDFNQGDTVVLSRTFRLGYRADKLQRIQLYFRPDDTWHELRLTVEKGGVRYVARKPVPLANFNWGAATWQYPGPDDQSTKIKTWVLLDEESRSPSYVSDPHEVKLTLELRRSSPARAWGDKLRMNYDRVLDYIPFWRYLATSLFLVILNVVLTLLSCSLIAYSFARLNWPGRDFCFLLMLATMMIPGQVMMIPHFLIWKWLGFYNTLTPLWLGSALGNAFFIFLLRQFLKGVPRDLEDAARIDGCGFLRIYWHIMLPLIKPSLAAIAIFTFMGTWNDFMGPLLYVADQRLYPLAFGLYAFSVQVGNNPLLTMAGSLLMTVPVILIFFFAQKYFIQGVTLTGMKG